MPLLLPWTTGTDWSATANWSGGAPAGGPSTAGDVDTITNTSTALVLFNTGDAGTAGKTVGRLTSATHRVPQTLAAGTGSGFLNLNNNDSGAAINDGFGRQGFRDQCAHSD